MSVDRDPSSPSSQEQTIHGSVLVVEDEPALLRAYTRMLQDAGFSVVSASDGESAAAILSLESFDVIVSDIMMPGMSGLDLLRKARERDRDVPVILVTGVPDMNTAIAAVEFGVLNYLVKPVQSDLFVKEITKASQLHRLALLKRDAVRQLMGDSGVLDGDRAGLLVSFGRALKSLRMVYQPIVDWAGHRIHAYEALLRSDEASLPNPPALLAAAERLGLLRELGQAIRHQVATAFRENPIDAQIFVNLHPSDLTDDELFHPRGALSGFASRVVLEITERASLEGIPEVRRRVASLRELGFRIAVDDLGAGYAGLTAIAQLQPEVVKIDMSLVRDVHREPIKQKLVGSMASLCNDMGMLVIAEGVETIEESDLLKSLRIPLMQGYYFGKPSPPFSAAQRFD